MYDDMATWHVVIHNFISVLFFSMNFVDFNLSSRFGIILMANNDSANDAVDGVLPIGL
jgi:hypothetical protein